MYNLGLKTFLRRLSMFNDQVKKIQWDSDSLEQLAKQKIIEGETKYEKLRILKNLEVTSFQVLSYLSGEINKGTI